MTSFRKSFIIFSLAGAVIMGQGCSSATKELKSTQVIDKSPHSYDIQLKGHLDGIIARDPNGHFGAKQYFQPNKYLELKNIGNEVVLNPRISVNQNPIFFSSDSIAGHVFEGYDTKRDKARVAYEFLKNNFFHASPLNSDNADIVKLSNIYGYMLCNDAMVALADLLETQGFNSYAMGPFNHDVIEVEYDGGLHLFDADQRVVYLKRDNKTIASAADIQRDPDLIRRTHHLGLDQEPNPDFNDLMTGYFSKSLVNKSLQDIVTRLDYDVKWNLYPEQIVRYYWSNQGRVHGASGWDYMHEHTYNGLTNLKTYVSRKEFENRVPFLKNIIKSSESDALTVDNPLKDALIGMEFSIPYVLVGGAIEIQGTHLNSNLITPFLSFNGRDWKEIEQYHSSYKHLSFAIDSFLKDNKIPPYKFHVAIRIGRSSNPNSELSISIVEPKIWFQHSAFTMPGLTLGNNNFIYQDDSESRNIQITHVWEENHSNHRPDPPKRSVQPKNRSITSSSAPSFKWSESIDRDGDKINEYHFQLSEYKDMRWPLSSNFDRLITPISGELVTHFTPHTEGLLNPGQTYYWRVRSRDQKGAWSEWSDIWQIEVGGPGVPSNLRIESEGELLFLKWNAPIDGSSPIFYEVFASNEKGFSVHREDFDKTLRIYRSSESEPWKYNRKRFKANLIQEIRGEKMNVTNLPFVYYRVVAVDANKIRSGVSEYAEVDHPKINEVTLPNASVGNAYSHSLPLIRSVGQMTAIPTSRTVHEFGYYNPDKMKFSLNEGPDWLVIDELTGELAGVPGEGGEGNFFISVGVMDGSGKKEYYNYSLTVLK